MYTNNLHEIAVTAGGILLLVNPALYIPPASNNTVVRCSVYINDTIDDQHHAFLSSGECEFINIIIKVLSFLYQIVTIFPVMLLSPITTLILQEGSNHSGVTCSTDSYYSLGFLSWMDPKGMIMDNLVSTSVKRNHSLVLTNVNRNQSGVYSCIYFQYNNFGDEIPTSPIENQNLTLLVISKLLNILCTTTPLYLWLLAHLLLEIIMN